MKTADYTENREAREREKVTFESLQGISYK